MNLNIEIPDKLGPTLKARANEHGITAADYASQVLERDLRSEEVEKKVDERPIWKVITEIMKDVPDEVFDRLPKDSASQIDHYLYGHPKR